MNKIAPSLSVITWLFNHHLDDNWLLRQQAYAGFLSHLCRKRIVGTMKKPSSLVTYLFMEAGSRFDRINFNWSETLSNLFEAYITYGADDYIDLDGKFSS